MLATTAPRIGLARRGGGAPGYRLADRFDTAQEIGTLKEAYVSWQPHSSLLLDAGRINGRQGVAFGYNPTDFFRSDAIRSVVSIDPNSLRDNRLGTVMLRGQQLWDSGALSVVYAPRLTDHATRRRWTRIWAHQFPRTLAAIAQSAGRNRLDAAVARVRRRRPIAATGDESDGIARPVIGRLH
jgi:hypothetical protein